MQNTDRIIFDENLKKEVKKVVTTVTKAVKSTLGPKGSNVGVLSPTFKPAIVNDGVTVIESVVKGFDSDLHKYIANILTSSSKQTETNGGDGTTTAATLTESIILEGLKLIEAGYSEVDVAIGIDLATKEILKHIEDNSIEVSDDLLVKVASISANNDNELGFLVADTFNKLGPKGIIKLENHAKKTGVEYDKSMRYSNGFKETSLQFSNSGNSITFEDCNILLYEGKLKSIEEVQTLLVSVLEKDEPIIIIADEYTTNAVQSVVGAHIQSGLKICLLRSPGYGLAKENDFEDISFVSGAKIISRRYSREIKDATYSHLGKVKSVHITPNTFSISNYDGIDLTERIKEIENSYNLLSAVEVKEAKERVANLSSSVATMYISGSTPIEIMERHLRAEDSVNATKSALEEGVLPGGGVALLKAAKSIQVPELDNEGQTLAFKALLKAVEAPAFTIAKNAGKKPDVILSNILNQDDYNYGYDAKNDTYGDLIELGVLDPKKVTRSALENASSVSQLILKMNCVIY